MYLKTGEKQLTMTLKRENNRNLYTHKNWIVNCTQKKGGKIEKNKEKEKDEANISLKIAKRPHIGPICRWCTCVVYAIIETKRAFHLSSIECINCFKGLHFANRQTNNWVEMKLQRIEIILKERAFFEYIV